MVNLEILDNFSSTKVRFKSGNLYVGGTFMRQQHHNGDVFWANSDSSIQYRLRQDVWSKWDEGKASYIPIDFEVKLEKEYQDLIATQNPFEKRIKEVINYGGSVQETMQTLSSDFQFMQIMREAVKKYTAVKTIFDRIKSGEYDLSKPVDTDFLLAIAQQAFTEGKESTL